MKRFALLSLGALALAACNDSPLDPGSLDTGAAAMAKSPGTVWVTNWHDNGHGSFRWAVEQASSDTSIHQITFKKNVKPVKLSSTVFYTGSQELAIDGDDGIIDASGVDSTAFVANGGASLSFQRLTVKNAEADGIAVLVPLTATGTIKVSLVDIVIMDNDGHGVLINDQVHPETEDGVQPIDTGSAASLEIVVENSSFVRNGYSVSDRDGLRINEGGDGSLTFVAKWVTSTDNGADGIELDERGAGDVSIDVQDTRLLRNGSFDPLDFDDGFDIDEYNDGSINGMVVRSVASDNYEEGLDFNENNAGDLRVDLDDFEAIGNPEEGIDYEEDDDFAGGGDLVTTMSEIVANENGGDGGVKIREKGLGSLVANIDHVEASGNVVSGLSVREDSDGSLTSTVSESETMENGVHGIDFDENSTGNLTAVVSDAVSSGNTSFGVRADQQTPGTGSLHLISSTVSGNGAGTVTGSNVVLTVTP